MSIQQMPYHYLSGATRLAVTAYPCVPLAAFLATVPTQSS